MVASCEHNTEEGCEIVYLINKQWIVPSPEICSGCQRDQNPMNINPITIGLSGIEIKKNGPGSTLHKIITWFIEQPTNCPCPNRVKLMDSWGPELCIENKKEILGWLRESARINNVKYNEFVLSATLMGVLYGCKAWEKTKKLFKKSDSLK